VQPQPDAAAAAAELVGQLQERARALGLTWQLVKATVTDGTDPSNVLATVDGDSVPIGMASMIGTVPSGARVWVMQVPPGGNYITGLLNGPYSARQSTTAVVSSVVFTGIPAGLRRLRVSYLARANNAVHAQMLFMRINADSTASYAYEFLQANNATAVGVPGSGVTAGAVGICTGASAGAGVFGSGQVEFQGWDQQAGNTTAHWTFVSQGLGLGVANFFAQSGGGVYVVTGPYTSLTFLPSAGSFIAGCDFQLEGWPT
jgi:hypothetical protein